MYLPRTRMERLGLKRGLPMIFIHTPKCGGSFVADAIGHRRERHCFTRRHPALRGHKTYLEYRQAFETLGININRFETFSVVRNPWAWHVSFYHYVRGLSGRNLEKAAAENAILSKQSFSDYLARVDNPEISDGIEFPTTRNVSDWVTDENGKIVVDTILRQENLRSEIERFQKKYSLQLAIPSAPINTSKHKDYRSYYSSADVDLVRRRHARDIELFGYDFNG